MDLEKARVRAYISQFIRVGKERYNDEDIRKLLYIIDNRDKYNGVSQRYEGLPEKGYSSEGRYDIQDVKTYTFICDEEGIRILYHLDRYIDGYLDNEEDTVLDTGRGILNNFCWILRKYSWSV